MPDVPADVRRAAALFATAFLWACTRTVTLAQLSAMPAGVDGDVRVEPYHVSGITTAEIATDLRRAARTAIADPRDTMATVVVRAPIEWHWRVDHTDDACTLSNVRVTVHVQIILPEWTPDSASTKGTVAGWNRTHQAEMRDANAHKNIAIDGTRRISKRLVAFTGPCATITADAERAAQALIADTRISHARYDSSAHPRPAAVSIPRPTIPGRPATFAKGCLSGYPDTTGWKRITAPGLSFLAPAAFAWDSVMSRRNVDRWTDGRLAVEFHYEPEATAANQVGTLDYGCEAIIVGARRGTLRVGHDRDGTYMAAMQWAGETRTMNGEEAVPLTVVGIALDTAGRRLMRQLMETIRFVVK